MILRININKIESDVMLRVETHTVGGKDLYGGADGGSHNPYIASIIIIL